MSFESGPVPVVDHEAAPPEPPRPPSGLADTLAAIARYVLDPYRVRSSNHVRLLRSGGETFPAMLAAIAGARRSVHLETYVFDDDRTGRRFADAMIERARAGVTVRLIYDGLGGLGMSSAFVARMRAAGIAIVEYHPVAPWRKRWSLSRRDHRKILVVDDEVGFAGGLNLDDVHADVADGGVGWHDMHCELRGAVVIDLARLFRRTWLGAGGADYPRPADPAYAAPPGTMSARVVDNGNLVRRRAIRFAYLRAFSAAERSIWIENAYFLPDRGLRRALVDAVRRGVEVSVIIPGRNNLAPVKYAALYLGQWLARRGVQFHLWRGPMLHAKTAVIDGVWSIIGSYNLDSVSLLNNLEVVVEVIDRDHGTVMAEQFATDRAISDPFDVAAWKRLPWWRKSLAWLAFRFRGSL